MVEIKKRQVRKDLERTNKVIAQMKNTNFSSIPVQQKRPGPNESLHARAKRLHGPETFKERINPFDEQSKEKRKYKRQESLDGNFNWKDKLRTTAKIGLWLFTGGRIGKKMQETAANAGKI